MMLCRFLSKTLYCVSIFLSNDEIYGLANEDSPKETAHALHQL